MATTQYIGSRYVPLFADPAEWNNTRAYEPLTIVLHEGNSYTSKQYVPKGIDISNADYWAETGNYNAQVEQYRKEVQTFDGRISKNSSDISKNSSDISLLKEVIVTPQMYGAKGDGVTDDAPAINAALNSLKEVGGTLLFPPGTYVANETIELPMVDTPECKVVVKGSGISSTIIESSADSAITMNGTSASLQMFEPRIEELTLKGNGIAKNGISSIYCGMARLNNLFITGFKNNGINFQSGVWMFNIEKTYINGCDYGIYIGDNCAGSSMRMVTAELNNINCYIGYTALINIQDCTFQVYKGQCNLKLVAASNINVFSSWFEGPDSSNTDIDKYDVILEYKDSSGNIGSNNSLTGCYFHGLGYGGKLTNYGIHNNCSNTVLKNNLFACGDGGYADYAVYDVLENSGMIGIGNQYKGTTKFKVDSAIIWQVNSGDTAATETAFMRAKFLKGVYFEEEAGRAYTYDGYLYSNKDRHRLEWSSQGKLWIIPRLIKSDGIPTTGTWNTGDVVLTNTPSIGNTLGWVCINGGTPGTWGRLPNLMEA